MGCRNSKDKARTMIIMESDDSLADQDVEEIMMNT